MLGHAEARVQPAGDASRRPAINVDSMAEVIGDGVEREEPGKGSDYDNHNGGEPVGLHAGCGERSTASRGHGAHDAIRHLAGANEEREQPSIFEGSIVTRSPRRPMAAIPPTESRLVIIAHAGANSTLAADDISNQFRPKSAESATEIARMHHHFHWLFILVEACITAGVFPGSQD